MTTDVVFLTIIIAFCVIGASKGFIKSVGGLLAVLVSWFVSKSLSLPISMWIFKSFDLANPINQAMSIFRGEATDYGTIVTNGIPGIRLPNVLGLTDCISQAVMNTFNASVANVVNMIVTIVLFSVCMLLCSMLVSLFQTAFTKIPLGKPINAVLGGVCGVIKGLIIAILVYYIMYILNVTLHANIPLNGVVIDKIFGLISNFHL